MTDMDYMVAALQESSISFRIDRMNIILPNGWSIVVNYTETGLGHSVYAVYKNNACKKLTISTTSVVNFLSEQEGIFSEEEV